MLRTRYGTLNRLRDGTDMLQVVALRGYGWRIVLLGVVDMVDGYFVWIGMGKEKAN